MSKKFIGLIGILILGTLGFRLYLITNAHSNNGAVYEITETNFGRNNETHFATKYKFDENRCCIFTDELGLEHTICGQVSITKY